MNVKLFCALVLIGILAVNDSASGCKHVDGCDCCCPCPYDSDEDFSKDSTTIEVAIPKIRKHKYGCESLCQCPCVKPIYPKPCIEVAIPKIPAKPIVYKPCIEVAIPKIPKHTYECECLCPCPCTMPIIPKPSVEVAIPKIRKILWPRPARKIRTKKILCLPCYPEYSPPPPTPPPSPPICCDVEPCKKVSPCKCYKNGECIDPLCPYGGYRGGCRSAFPRADKPSETLTCTCHESPKRYC